MSGTTYLQIRGGEDETTRVVELPGAAIRVGRGSLCEVRLTDSALADVQCLLRRRGSTWHVQPIGPGGLISMGGRAVEHLCSLPPDETLSVGSYRLMIRREEDDGFRTPIDVSTASESRVGVVAEGPTRPVDPPSAREDMISEADRLRRWQARAELRERWQKARQEEKRWEARWKAAGDELRSRGPVPTRSAAGDSSERAPADRSSGSGDAPQGRLASHHTSPRTAPAMLSSGPADVIESHVAPDVHPRVPTVPEPEHGGGERSNEVDRLERPIGPTAARGSRSERASSEETGLTSSRGLRIPRRAISSRSSHQPGSSDSMETTPVSRPAHADAPREFLEDEPRTHAASPSSGGPERNRTIDGGSSAVATGAAPPREGTGFFEAATIMAAQGRRVVPQAELTAVPRRRKTSHPIPTEPVEPNGWLLPMWVAVPACGMGAVVVAGVGLILALIWTSDNLAAGLAARAALRSQDAKYHPLDPSANVETRWWRTTAEHLALWSAAIERSPEAEARRDEVREVLEAARRTSPLLPSVRYAAAESVAGFAAPAEGSGLGLSRDVVALTFTGRFLKRAGKTGPALKAYRAAIEMAAGAEPARLASPGFDDDPAFRRFRLPHEAIVGGVIRDMIEAADWRFADWLPALPSRATVRLTAARILREKGDADAERALALVLADDVQPQSPSFLAAEELAAQAEALALTERRQEAADRYREAISSMDDDPTRRRWLLALAEILVSLGQPRERAEILEAAKSADPTDEVTRRALEAQRFAGLK